jgi:hypothetical protein
VTHTGFDVRYFIPNSLIASFLRFVNKLKKKSVQKYFYERCAGGPKSSDFWPTIKPFFLSSKGVKTNNSRILKKKYDYW